MDSQVAVVTGAGTGIGRAICLAFAQRGASVVATARNTANLEETGSLVREAGGKCLVYPSDLSDARNVVALTEAVVERFGRIDILVNNAAQAIFGKVEDIDLAAFDAMLAINCAGVLYMCQSVWPLMKRGRGGTIINISSMSATDPFPGLAVYGATKAFVNLLTKGLAEEGRAHNIAVFAVGPGAVETAMLRNTFPDFPPEQTLPPSAIADVVVRLTEPPARYCTGQTIYVRR